VGGVLVHLETDAPRTETIQKINAELSGRGVRLEYWAISDWVEFHSAGGNQCVLRAACPLARAVADSGVDKMAAGLRAFVRDARTVISTQGGLACVWAHNREGDGVLTFDVKHSDSSHDRVTLQKGGCMSEFTAHLLAACAGICGSAQLSAVKQGLYHALNKYLAEGIRRIDAFTREDGQGESAAERVLGVHIDALKAVFQKEGVPFKLITGPDYARGEWQRLVQLGTGLGAHMLFLDTRSYATGEEGYVARWKDTEQALLYAGHMVSQTCRQELQSCIKQFAYSMPLLGDPDIDGKYRPVDSVWTGLVKQIAAAADQPKRDPYAERRLALNAEGLELHPGIVTTVRERHMKILQDDLNKKLVVMATQDDTWGGENP